MDQDLAQKGSADWNPAAGTREADKSGDQALPTFKPGKCDMKQTWTMSFPRDDRG